MQANFRETGSVLERFELDHMRLNLFVSDCLTKAPLGRPWLTIAIDSYSRMVAGFHVSFRSPSDQEVLECLRQAVQPKDEWLARFPDIQQPWPASGIPTQIAVDIEAERGTDALETACLEMGIQIRSCGSRTPQHKGATERFFGAVNVGLVDLLPGTVFSRGGQANDRPDENNAVVDMETLVQLLTKWVVDVYNVTDHPGIGERPLNRWMESVAR